MHYGLLPRANRGIFAINELPDLAGKIQVGLFNILQEGDVQIKGYPVRLPLDLLMVFTANPEDYTARGKIITPLKDRIGAEIRTHYRADPTTRDGHHRAGGLDRAPRRYRRLQIPSWVREVVEEVAFQARADRRVDKRSGVSQRLPISVLENVASNAERRALVTGEGPAVGRVSDIYAAIPSMTGKFELEDQGELKGADTVARELIRGSVANVFLASADSLDTGRLIEWFAAGGSRASKIRPAPRNCSRARSGVPGLIEASRRIGIAEEAPLPLRASAVEFILEGLAATKRISRSDEHGYQAAESPEPRRRAPREEPSLDDMRPMPGGKKKYTTEVAGLQSCRVTELQGYRVAGCRITG